MQDLDLEADLNAQDDEGLGWSTLADAIAPDRVRPGAMLLAGDSRIGTEGEFRIGLPEVAIGMTMPVFGIELARNRLPRNRFTEAVTQARIYGPADAVAVGYLDEAVPAAALMETAKTRAAALATLQQPAFANTKRKERQAAIALIRGTLKADSGTFDGAQQR